MIPERYAPMTYALFRIVFGLIFFMFGMQKLAGWFGGQQMPIMGMLGAAGVIDGENDLGNAGAGHGFHHLSPRANDALAFRFRPDHEAGDVL